jgi:integrase
MVRKRLTYDRVLGPYRDRGSTWRLLIKRADGGRDPFFFSSEARARSEATKLRALIGEIRSYSIMGALNEYEIFLRDKGNKPDSVKQTKARLVRFFPDQDLQLTKLTEKACAGYYRAFVEKGLKADSHRNYLAEAKTFLGWTVSKGWLHKNPLEKVQGVGKRHHGKAQLRIDEARQWMAKAQELADGGDVGAVAAMMLLLMGMRAGEVVARVARDLDDGGTILVIATAKTEAGRRVLNIPWLLQGYLRRLADGKEPGDYLFPSTRRQGGRYIHGGHRYRDWPRENVQRICRLAGVPKVTAHGMRGLHASLAAERGITGQVVAAALGHESFATTQESYTKRGAVEGARQRKALKVLEGKQ